MYLKFIKSHVSGLKKGACIKTDSAHGKSLIKSKFCEEVEEEEFLTCLEESKKEIAKKVAEKHSEADEKELEKLIAEEEKEAEKKKD